MTTAMIASNSFWVPRSVSAEPVTSTWIAANSVAARAVKMNSVILVRATGTPILRAALASPPEAKIQLPKRVRVRSQVQEQREADPPDDRHRNAVMAGRPSARLPINAEVGEPANRRLENLAREQGVSQSPCGISCMPETWVRPVMPRVTPSVRPRSMNRLPSVTMKDGSPVLHHDQAVEIAHEPRNREGEAATSQTGQPQHDRRDGDDNAGKADHRADRQIEFAGDHQQRHGGGEDAELGRDLEEIDDALGAEQAAVAGGDREEDEDQDGSGHGAKLGPAQQPAEQRNRADPFVAAPQVVMRMPPAIMAVAAEHKLAGRRATLSACPALASSMTEAAVSLVTKPGPVG